MANEKYPPPSTLGEVGETKWRETVKKLTVHSPFTLGQLEVYCAAYERWAAAQSWLAEHGDTMELVNDKGIVVKVQPAPKLEVAARAEKAMKDSSQRLGEG